MNILGMHPPVRSDRGFALVITLTLMILLTVIAVGLLTLSSISLRNSSKAVLVQEARQNARLALVIAIGELQTATGPDQRVTATAGVIAGSPARPRLTGVWKGWKWNGAGPAPDFKKEKTERFVRWLVSSRDAAAAGSPDYAKQAITGNQVSLVKGVTDPLDGVAANIVPIATGRGSDSQGFAWAVFDESEKIPTALPEPEGDSLAVLQNRMTAAPLPGYASATVRNWGPLGTMANKRLKLITPEQSALAELAPGDRRFHDLTSRTAGLAVDVAKGGLAADMSRLFDKSTIDPDYEGRYLYSETDSPLVPPPARFTGANPFPSPDPSWRLLHSHYRSFDKISGGTAPIINNSTMARPAAGTAGPLAQKNPFFHNQQILPVISKAQFVFSLSFGYHAALDYATSASLPAAQKDSYVTWLVIDPVITLWNPYNVTMRYTGGRIDLYRIPLGFRIYKNGTLINSEYTQLANTFLGGDMNDRNDTFYRLNLLPEKGNSDITLAPGEHIVLTASNHVKHFGHEYMTRGLDLRPGFSPPAGNASVGTVGGTSTLNVCVSSNGNSNGKDYDKPVRTVAVKAGDEIQVEVKPMHANVDKPKETGGKEISGFLKYYSGPPNSPRLVGGVELDYGSQESTYLESFSRNEMPNLVVSGAIPKNAKADDYQGSKPPIVVRFKEPFLISTFQLKTERDSKFPSRGWIENSPVNAYASAGLDQTEPWEAQQYEFQWEAMTDWPPSSPTIEISNNGNRGYGGPGIYAQSGLEFATHSSLPLEPALSIPQLRHAPLNTGGQLPLVSQIVGNSFQPPLMDSSTVRSTAGERTFLDHSFFANNALFDSHFFSGVADSGGPLPDKSGDAKAKLTAFFDQGKPLPNPRFIAWRGGSSTQDIVDRITTNGGYRKTAAHLLIDSPFNVNSTGVDVWEALLASAFGAKVPVINGGTIDRSAGGTTIPVTRHLPSAGSDLEGQTDPNSRDLATWNGYRRLEPAQIRSLAEEIVTQVRERGPFLSLAEFVNRRPGNGDPARSGALQTALGKSGINSSVLNPGSDLPTLGNSADGAPGVLTQADLLTPIAPILTARGDTFRIRAFGEAGPANGPKIRVWCEAVVQRIPEYLDPAEEPWADPQLPVNKRFGRRYLQISFRWLSPSEI